MNTILEGLGIYIWPLGLCSLLAVTIVIERLIVLRHANVLSREVGDMAATGSVSDPRNQCSGSRLVRFWLKETPSRDMLHEFTELELVRLERGMFLAESVVTVAPMLGLLGTVSGLLEVFGQMTAQESGQAANLGAFGSGIALALTTTIAGLVIAMVALMGVNLLHRKLDIAQARLFALATRLAELPHPGRS